MAIESPIVEIFNSILITGVVYGFTFNTFIFFSKKRKGKPLFYLNLIVLAITLNNLQAWLIDMGYISSFVYIRHLRVPWYFLCMPLFYVFLVYYLKIQEKVKSYLFTTVIIFIGMIVLRLALIVYTQLNDFSEIETRTFISNYSTYEEIVGFIYSIFIFIYAVLILTKNKKWYEYVLNFDDLKWIKHFLVFGAIILVIWIVAILRSYQDSSFSSPNIYFSLRLCTSVLIYWVGFKGIFRYQIMEDRIILRENIKKEIISENNTDLDINTLSNEIKENEKVKSEKQLNLFNKINTSVINKKKFLDPYLSLESLANDLKISNGHLSFLVNTYSKKHFSDYINEFRVDQVKKLIVDKEFINYTIESIGLESGFNSKSTFYSAFKKFTNLSPLQFKRQFVS